MTDHLREAGSEPTQEQLFPFGAPVTTTRLSLRSGGQPVSSEQVNRLTWNKRVSGRFSGLVLDQMVKTQKGGDIVLTRVIEVDAVTALEFEEEGPEQAEG